MQLKKATYVLTKIFYLVVKENIFNLISIW